MNVPGWLTGTQLASGDGALVYRVSRGEQQGVLKLARDPRNESYQEALAREIAVLARLSHSGIVRLLDHGHGDCGTYIVTEWIDGEFADLAYQTRVVDDPGGPGHVVPGWEGLLGALTYLHGQGLVHSDLKPANIRVRRSTGEPVLIDFGSATGDDGRVTAAYASPEQLLGAPVTAASDVYQCGLLLYELLTGRHPFLDGDPERAHPDWVPPLPDPQLDRLMVRCLAPNPADRFADASQLRAAWQSQAAQRSRPAWRVRSFARTHGRKFLAASVFLTALSALGAVYLDRTERARVIADSRLLGGLVRELQPLAERPGNLAARAKVLQQVEQLAVGLERASYRDETVGYELAGYYHDLAGMHGEIFAYHTGDYPRSIRFQQHALAIMGHWRRRLPQSDRWLLLEAGASLEYGDLLFGARRWPQALAQYRESFQVWQQWLARHPDDANAQFTASVARSMEGDALAELGRPQESLPLQAEVLALRRRHLAAGHPWAAEALASVLESIGDCRYRLRQWRDAQRALDEALQIRQSIKGEGRYVAQLHMRMAKLEQVTQHPERAAAHWKQARGQLERVCASEPASPFDRQLLAEVSAELAAQAHGEPPP